MVVFACSGSCFEDKLGFQYVDLIVPLVQPYRLVLEYYSLLPHFDTSFQVVGCCEMEVDPVYVLVVVTAW
jgi:hypothetical protein